MGVALATPIARWKNRRAAAGDLLIGLVHSPAVTDGMAAGSGGLGQ
jgi:hypothetical protein